MRKFALALIAAVGLLSPSSARGDAPLFDALERFCVSTQTEPNAVRAAVEAAGGRERVHSATTASPFAMTMASWDITVADHRMLVSAGSGRPAPSKGGTSNDFDGCTIVSFADEEASIEQIRQWIGVPPEAGASSDFATYDYEQEDSKRSPISNDKDALRAVQEQGRIWTLVILRSREGKQTSVQLTHSLGTNRPPQ